MADLGKFPGTEMEVFSKYPDSYRLDHPTFGDVRKTTYAKGIISDFGVRNYYPLRLDSTVKVTGAWGESEFIPLFYCPKKGYWDSDDAGYCNNEDLTVIGSQDFDPNLASYKQAYMSFRVGDEVNVLFSEGVPKAVLGHYDGVLRVGADIFKFGGPTYPALSGSGVSPIAHYYESISNGGTHGPDTWIPRDNIPLKMVQPQLWKKPTVTYVEPLTMPGPGQVGNSYEVNNLHLYGWMPYEFDGGWYFFDTAMVLQGPYAAETDAIIAMQEIGAWAVIYYYKQQFTYWYDEIIFLLGPFIIVLQIQSVLSEVWDTQQMVINKTQYDAWYDGGQPWNIEQLKSIVWNPGGSSNKYYSGGYYPESGGRIGIYKQELLDKLLAIKLTGQDIYTLPKGIFNYPGTYPLFTSVYDGSEPVVQAIQDPSNPPFGSGTIQYGTVKMAEADIWVQPHTKAELQAAGLWPAGTP